MLYEKYTEERRKFRSENPDSDYDDPRAPKRPPRKIKIMLKLAGGNITPAEIQFEEGYM